MTQLFQHSFEGTDGADLTQASSGLNLVQAGWKYSAAHVPTSGGSTAAKVAQATAASNVMNGLNVWTAAGVVYYRFYLYIETAPSATTSIFQIRNGTSVVHEVRLLTTGALQTRNASTTQIDASPTTLMAAGTMYRIEGKVDLSNQQAQVKVYKGSNYQGSTPDYDSGLITSANGGNTSSTGWQAGVVNAAIATLHFDELIVNNTGFPGPTVPSNQPPTITLAADHTTGVEPGSTVTLTATASDPDGTVSSITFTQTAGPTVTLAGTGSTRQFKAPPTDAGTTVKFTTKATDNSGAQTTSNEVSVAVLEASNYVLTDAGTWQPTWIELI